MSTSFSLPPLPFDAAALEPAMSRDTLNTHHGKHHAAYVKAMNAILAERADPPKSVEAVIALAKRENNRKLFNNAAQAWNHAFFWQSLSPQNQAGPQGALKAAIEKAYGSLEAFREAFIALGVGHFASGWVWLVAEKGGAVKLIDTHDAETVVTDGAITPLIVSDVWEHAYYLDHKNDRAAFVKGFIEKLANWRFAEAQYEAAQKGEAGWRYPG